MLAWLGRRCVGGTRERSLLGEPAVCGADRRCDRAGCCTSIPVLGMLVYQILSMLGLGVVVFTLIQGSGARRSSPPASTARGAPSQPSGMDSGAAAVADTRAAGEAGVARCGGRRLSRGCRARRRMRRRSHRGRSLRTAPALRRQPETDPARERGSATPAVSRNAAASGILDPHGGAAARCGADRDPRALADGSRISPGSSLCWPPMAPSCGSCAARRSAASCSTCKSCASTAETWTGRPRSFARSAVSYRWSWPALDSYGLPSTATNKVGTTRSRVPSWCAHQRDDRWCESLGLV
jgi:hypothetical protein